MKEVLRSHFWNQEVESVRSVDAVVCSLPYEPPPLPSHQSSRISRPQQLLLLQRLFSVPFTPSYIVDSDHAGGLVLDRVLASVGGKDWWGTVTGRIRVQRLWTRRKERNGDTPSSASPGQSETSDSPSSVLENVPWLARLQDPSLYALSGRWRMLLGQQTWISAATELNSFAGMRIRRSKSDSRPEGRDSNGGRVPWRGRVGLLHKTKKHDLSVEAAWHQSCVDRQARYWDVPGTLAVDLSSRGAAGGLRYRVGIHRSSGIMQTTSAVDASDPSPIPWGARVGTRAQAAVSVEKELSLWKGPLQKGKQMQSVLSARPRLTLSGMCGGLLSAHLRSHQQGLDEPIRLLHVASDDAGHGIRDGSLRPPALRKFLSADVFASGGVTARIGKFERIVLDHTVLRARLDCGAASAFAIAATDGSNWDRSLESEYRGGCPTLTLSVQQQILGPLRARFETRLAVNQLSCNVMPHIQETMYGLDMTLDRLGAARFVAWYSPTRREGMAEIRLLEK